MFSIKERHIFFLLLSIVSPRPHVHWWLFVCNERASVVLQFHFCFCKTPTKDMTAFLSRYRLRVYRVRCARWQGQEEVTAIVPLVSVVCIRLHDGHCCQVFHTTLLFRLLRIEFGYSHLITGIFVTVRWAERQFAVIPLRFKSTSSHTEAIVSTFCWVYLSALKEF